MLAKHSAWSRLVLSSTGLLHGCSLRKTHAACAVSNAVSLPNNHAAFAEANNVLCRKLPAKFGDLLSEDQLKEIEELGLLADLDDQVWIS